MTVFFRAPFQMPEIDSTWIFRTHVAPMNPEWNGGGFDECANRQRKGKLGYALQQLEISVL